MSFVVGFAKALQEKSDRDYKDKTREEDRQYDSAEWRRRFIAERQGAWEDRQYDSAEWRRRFIAERQGDLEDRQEDRQYEEDEWTRRFIAERQGAWEDTIMKTSLTSGGGRSGSGKGEGSGTTNPEIWIRGLAARGVKPEVIAKLAETGNPDLFKQAYEVVDEQWMAYRDDWGDDPEAKQQFYTQIVSPMFNEMVITSPVDSPLFGEDFKQQMTDLYGGVLPEHISQALNSTVTTPGSALMTPGLGPQKSNPSEVSTIRGIEKEALLETAVENLRNLQDELAAITIKQTEGTSSEEEDARAMQLNSITRGLADDISAAKDNNILGPLRSVFGAEVGEQLNGYFRDSGRIR